MPEKTNHFLKEEAPFSRRAFNNLLVTWRSFAKFLPMLFAVVLLTGLLNALIPKEFYQKIFSHFVLLDSFFGALFGSIMAGNPITSYILGGELLKQGISLVAVLSFIVSWVTVGIVQLPAESVMLGKRFSIVRNIVSFIFAIIVSLLTVLTLKIL